jgi:hypothetical protein
MSEVGDGQISFDDWTKRVFDHHVIDPEWWWKEETDWNNLPSSISLDYLSRLFEESSQLPHLYSDAQIDQGLWFLIGPRSDDIAHFLLDLSIPWPMRLRAVRSIICLFELFASRCSLHLSHLDEPGASPLNSICYMFWDIFPIQRRPDEPRHADLDDSLLTILTEILSMPSDACRESALHGLGHWHLSYPREVEQIIDSFIVLNPTIRPELRQYAGMARIGKVL